MRVWSKESQLDKTMRHRHGMWTRQEKPKTSFDCYFNFRINKISKDQCSMRGEKKLQKLQFDQD